MIKPGIWSAELFVSQNEEPYENQTQSPRLARGGALGAYAYGVIKALYEQPDFSLDVVTGVSIGAINAAVLVGAKDDPIRALDELWRERLAIRNWPFTPPMLERYSSLLANPAMYWIRPSYVYTPFLA